jgi:hypothetical protein
VSGCEIMAKNFADGQGRTNKKAYEWQINNLKYGSWARN